MRFSLKAIFGLILVAAIVCGVMFAAPQHIRLAALFVGVLAMPGPLVSLAVFGRGRMRVFAAAGLSAYGAWFVLVGIPGGFYAMNHFSDYVGISLSNFGASLSGAGAMGGGYGGGGMAFVVVPTYLLLSWLYAPWLIVPLAGIAAVACQACCRGEANRDDASP